MFCFPLDMNANREMILLKSNDQRKLRKLYETKNGIEIVKNQLIESYQSGVVEDRLIKKRSVPLFNNQNK